MAMLDRYKKTGGFNQLLTLLETCGPQKQQKFLEIIRQEDPRWADALVAKMIDLKRVLAWSESAISEITGAMLDINIAMIISSVSDEEGARLLGTLPHVKRRKVSDLIEKQKPTPGDVATSINKLHETVRRLSQEGVLRLDKVDPMLFVDEDIEDRLKQGKAIVGVLSASDSLAKMVAASGTSQTDSDSPHLQIVTAITHIDQSPQSRSDGKDSSVFEQENILLKKRMQLLQNENQVVRQELANALARLEQIKKLA